MRQVSQTEFLPYFFISLRTWATEDIDSWEQDIVHLVPGDSYDLITLEPWHHVILSPITDTENRLMAGNDSDNEEYSPRNEHTFWSIAGQCLAKRYRLPYNATKNWINNLHWLQDPMSGTYITSVVERIHANCVSNLNTR